MSLQPRPHQVEAISSAVSALSVADRTTVVMACGTGKTLVGQRAVESVLSDVDNPIILHLSPSLGLLDQSYRAWVENSAHEFEAIAVCSDTNIGKDDADGVLTSDLQLPTTTDSEILNKWLDKNSGKARVVFTTFQSSQAIVDSRNDWDAALVDEAHRTASRRAGLFSTILDDSKINVSKRLFMTATPKTWISAKEDVVSMDDESLYGKHCHKLSFSKAQEIGLLAGYQVVISAVSDREAQRIILDNPRLSIPGQSRVTADLAASQTVLNQAIREYGLNRVLVFHNRVAESKLFTTTLQSVTDVLPVESQAGIPLVPVHIDGKHGAEQRQHVLSNLENTDNDKAMIVSNVRTLAEGIDVPALDAIMFADPRSSQIEIAQATGRVMRINPKRSGDSVIILPVHLADGESPEEMLCNSKLGHVWKTIVALAANDEDFAVTLNEQRLHKGSGRKSNFPQAIKFVGEGFEDTEFLKAIEVMMIEMTTSSWWDGLRELDEFIAREGHATPYAKYVSSSGYKLGAWLSDQRENKTLDRMLQEREEALTKRGMIWDVLEARFLERMKSLDHFIKEYGHSNVPSSYIDHDGNALGYWIVTNRRLLKTGKMSKFRESEFDKRGLNWAARDTIINSALSEALRELDVYISTYKNSDMANNYVSPSGYRLGKWLSRQRTRYSANDLPTNAIEELNMRNISWMSAYERVWWDSLGELDVYNIREGHVNVSEKYTSPTGHRTGLWLRNQRESMRLGKLSTEKIKILNQRGVVWDPIENQVDRGIEELDDFIEREGHSNVPAKYTSLSGHKLGIWLSNKKSLMKDGSLPVAMQKELEKRGIKWNILDSKFNNMMSEMDEFILSHGHHNVPRGYISPRGFKLGTWYSNQRAISRRNGMKQQRKDEFSSRGIVMNSESISDRPKAVSDKEVSDLKTMDKAIAIDNSSQKMLDRLDAIISKAVRTRNAMSLDGTKVGRWITDLRKANLDGTIAPEIEAALSKRGVTL